VDQMTHETHRQAADPHAGHEMSTMHGNHDRHAGHSVAMFRDKFWFRTHREVSIGAVYATLDRLETKGYVKSHRGDPTPERGGRSKRFFRVTANGVAAVSRTHRALQSMTEGLGFIRSYA
jgi:hypothetical protein